MKITKLKMYKDGGTVEIITDDSSFCFDNRIGTKTKYELYDGYPKDDNSNIIEDSKFIQSQLLRALIEYKKGKEDDGMWNLEDITLNILIHNGNI